MEQELGQNNRWRSLELVGLVASSRYVVGLVASNHYVVDLVANSHCLVLVRYKQELEHCNFVVVDMNIRNLLLAKVQPKQGSQEQ